MADFLEIKNGQAVALRDIPRPAFAHWQTAVLRAAGTGGIVQLFGCPEAAGEILLLAVMRQGRRLLVSASLAPEVFPSLTLQNRKFHLFERELAEQWGLRPEGHPWLKAVRYHANYSGRPDAFANDYRQEIPGNYPYYRVEGEEIHEVGVGPVHAGIIEPGHFRFQCIGEKVLHLEIQLGFQHRGVEQLLTRCESGRRAIIAESAAGDTSIGNSLCFSEALEGLAGLEVARGARILRSLALELERLACHIGDLGALAGDVAFSPAAAYFGRMRGEVLNLLLLLAGNRFGRGLVRPGGLGFQVGQAAMTAIKDKLRELRPQLLHVSDLLFSAHTVLARFEGCGKVRWLTAESIGMVGVAGRASGIPYDARTAFPSAAYEEMEACRHTRTTGDVMARAWIRYEEMLHSLDFVERLAGEVKGGKAASAAEADAPLMPDALVVTINEAWRGELSHCLLTDKAGNIRRYKIKDPSFHNWTGLALALRDEAISDFPLNNKSFNLSYCGFDL